jgi:sporulation protein YlmC with PRC-barrel domain
MAMVRIFAKNLSKKNVMSSDGSALGVLYNIVMNIHSGELINLVVKPDLSVDKSLYQLEGNYMLIPFGAVRAVKDFIVVDKNEAMMR